ncbi:MAG TPA: helix-turn-helix domain-containing protein [Acidimicrobiales bacterium]|nr:helix-turn-helix domain-containing protein [Acidimicrobiales bacterium]
MAPRATSARESAEGAARAFGAYLRAQRKAAQLSLRELADLAQISNPYLSQIERGLHQPSVTVIRSLAEALNLSAEVLLAEAAGLERVVGDRVIGERVVGERATRGAAGASVERALQADDRLTSAQKKALLAVYRSMVEGA